MDLTNPVEASVDKHDERLFTISLWRASGNKGLAVNVHTHPKLEALMMSFGDGSAKPIALFGPHWVGEQLEVYDLNEPAPLGMIIVHGGLKCTLNKVAEPRLFVAEGSERDRTPVINISFLRLVGSSRDGGVSFTIPGVYTLKDLNQTGEVIKLATKRIIIDYLADVKINVVGYIDSSPSNGVPSGAKYADL